MYYQRTPYISRSVDRGLGLSLDDLGTGVAQVLASLTGKKPEQPSPASYYPPPGASAGSSSSNTTVLLVGGIAAVAVLGVLVFKRRSQ
jgi:LPXTG-motif cell wall-anchored protein